MRKMKVGSVARSNTNRELPSIGLQTPRQTNDNCKSTYLSKISKQICGNIEYDDMNNLHLTKQQQKLKEILKKMNDDTVKIISAYTPRAKKNYHRRTTTSVLAVNDREMQNNNQILLQCQVEIEKLKVRANGLGNKDKEHFDAQIKSITSEIAIIQETNREIKHENDKRGRMIVTEQRIIDEGEIRRIETDVYLLEHKASRLRSDDQRVDEEIADYEAKLKKIQSKYLQAERYLVETERAAQQKLNLKGKEMDYAVKLSKLEAAKKKNEFYQTNFQYRYYHCLRKLDSVNSSTRETQEKINKVFISIEASKMALAKLQSKHKQLKKLSKEREKSVNQFLKFSKLQRKEDDEGEMPSEIEIKQDEGNENSEIIQANEKSGRSASRSKSPLNLEP